MKKRILFVDDEQLILQGLQRMLRPLRNEWEMEFVESAAKALEAMDKNPFDAVVSDMLMPGMNGAELLGEVMKRHPKTARLILSGHADRDLIMKCVGTTHQYMAKPCDPEMLKATVARTTSLGFSLHNERLAALVTKMNQLPSLPSLYAEIVKLLKDPEVSMEDVGNVIARDIAMTAQTLKLVNSAFFGLRREVSSPAEAASYLGADVLKSLVLSINVFSQFDTAKAKGFSVELLWRHSFHTSAAAKLIAQTEKADQQVVNESFTAGMLHDTGKLVLVANFAEQFGQAVELAETKKITILEAEQEVFGATHAEVGGYLLGLWGLPVPVVEAIALHHSPGTSFIRSFCALTAVHVADALTQKSVPVADGSASAQVDGAYLAGLGLSERLPAWQAAVQASLSKTSN